MKKEKGNEMKFTFDYKETLERRVTIEADNLAEAILEVERRIDDEEIVLSAEDFAGGQLSMPLETTCFPRLECYGEVVKGREGLDLVIDFW